MKRELGDLERLLHIQEAIENVESFLHAMTFDEFVDSTLHRSASERQLEIIGEATAALSDALKIKYSEVEWRPIKRFRNVIVHEYFGVSVQILWGVIQKELPVLKIQIQKIIQELEN
jgi:uncharacterized protein with HEPN domain